MEIRKDRQHNQAVGKYKILSSNAGVGSLVTTKWGGFIMPLSIDKWDFIEQLTKKIKNTSGNTIDVKELESQTGVEIIDDPRFVDFLAAKKNFANLRCFAVVPHVQLDLFNQIDYKSHPMYDIVTQTTGNNPPEKRFYIPAINFPKWFISGNSELRPIKEWITKWRSGKCNDGRMDFFVPPRDPNRKTYRTMPKENLKDNHIYELLKPVPLVLICQNGHISDIPWYKFFCAALENPIKVYEDGFDLFGYHCSDCPSDKSSDGKHKIKWITSRNQAESWGTLKCEHCGGTVQLAGIMNLKPKCIGERPWDPDENNTPTRERCMLGRSDDNSKSTRMQVAMVTSNSIYYAYGFSSLYIPKELIKKRNGELSTSARLAFIKVSKRYETLVQKDPNITKEQVWDRYYSNADDFIENADLDWNLTDLTPQDYTDIKNKFLDTSEDNSGEDLLATYRFAEFEVLSEDDGTSIKTDSLEFNAIKIPKNLRSYFKSIKQVSTLAITSTQLGFGRVNMPTAKLVDGHVISPDQGTEFKPIYSGTASDVFVLPANQTFGEGLFFAFDETVIQAWVDKYKVDERYICSLEQGAMGEFLYSEMSLYGKAKFYLLHTFSHLIMKELEFSCGYPTASLSERLYYSDKMCGVLIYTADGAEGSMGGLVWQGQPELIENIIKSALNRATDCSSDPLCWENEDGLNRASCFACTMVSETSCEHANMALDRRALVDDEFGFFKDLIENDTA